MSTRTTCIAFCVATTIAFASLAHATVYTNPGLVNLLERWNTNGTYAFTTTNNAPLANNVYQMIDFPLGGTGFRGTGVGNPVGTGSTNLFARFTFDAPKRIDEVLVQFRDAGHSPDNYTFSDQNGAFVTTSTPGVPIGGSVITHTFAPRVSNYIEISANPRSTNTSIFEIVDLGAYLAPGEVLKMDGTYNVFYEENPAPTGFNSSLWTNLIADRLNPGNANSTTWAFTGRYKFTGAYMSHEIFTKNMEGAKIEISEDGTTWNTAFGAADFGQGYMVFNQAYWGKYARLSWADSGVGGGEEIHEFQLFVYVPEPSSALAMLGIGGLLARRRR